MTISWRKSSLNKGIGNLQQPENHPLDAYMAMEKFQTEECLMTAKTVIAPFSIHNERSLLNFLHIVNIKLGERFITRARS